MNSIEVELASVAYAIHISLENDAPTIEVLPATQPISIDVAIAAQGPKGDAGELVTVNGVAAVGSNITITAETVGAQRKFSEPSFTRDSYGKITQIDYEDGSIKMFSYISGKLAHVDVIADGVTTRKIFNRVNGVLKNINEVQL